MRINRRTVLVGAAASLLVSRAQAAPMSAIEWPASNRVFQQDGTGKASFTVQWRGGQSVRLKLNGNVIATATDGKFLNVDAGWYQVALVDGGVEVDEINVGVGDVFVITGASNAGSFGTPLVMASRPGLCVLANYGGQYINDNLPGRYIDAGVVQSIYSLGWIHLANIRDKSYPTMFVNVARGFTDTFEWLTSEWTRGDLARALWEHKPKAELWVQGEKDCTSVPPDSFNNMDAMTDRLWQYGGAVPRFIAYCSFPPNLDWPISHAQHQLITKWNTEPKGYMCRPGPDIDPIRSATDVHDIDWAAYGQIWANALAAENF